MLKTTELKVGDEVAWKARNGQWRVTRVARVLSTVIDTEDAMRWIRKSGKEYGAGCGPCYIREVTQEAREDDEKRRLVSRLRCVNWDKVALYRLRHVADALEGAVL